MNQSSWFRRLLKLLPSDFQADYAREMERTFRAQQQDARRDGSTGVARLWLETIVDLASTAPRQHAERAVQDVRQGLRMIAHRPGFSAVAVLVFALGIAAVTSVFSVVDAALLRPVPFEEPERLVVVREQTDQDPRPWELSFPSYLELARDARSFESLAAFMQNGILLGGPEPSTSLAALVSRNLLDTLRVRPIAGRNFVGEDDVPGGAAVVLISERLARARFGLAHDAVGRTIPIDDRQTTIVGALGDSFRFPDDDVDVWLPLGQLGDEPWMRNRSVHVALAARTREIGIRSAIGATSAVLTRQLLLEGLQPALLGVSVGLIGGALAGWTMRALLFEVTPRDTWTYAGTLVTVIGISIASCWFPARRAARIDPAVALRTE